jgi:hypothetical protein
MIYEIDILHIERDLITTFTHILLAMDITVPSLGLFPQLQGTKKCSTVFFGTHVEIFPLETGNNLKVLYQAITFGLFLELGNIPVLGDVV